MELPGPRLALADEHTKIQSQARREAGPWCGNQHGSREREFEQMARSGSTETSRRGFAAMDPAKQREIASKGGKAAHQKGTAHEFTPDEARVAGKKGGDAVSRDREHMARIGREGGQARAANRARQDRDRAAAMPPPEDQRPPQLQAEEEE
jgi:uncharacterized protein